MEGPSADDGDGFCTVALLPLPMQLWPGAWRQPLVGAVLGFLVFGPMMDIKKCGHALLSGFKSGFVIRLAVTAFLVCFTGLSLFMASGNGGYCYEGWRAGD